MHIPSVHLTYFCTQQTNLDLLLQIFKSHCVVSLDVPKDLDIQKANVLTLAYITG